MVMEEIRPTFASPNFFWIQSIVLLLWTIENLWENAPSDGKCSYLGYLCTESDQIRNVKTSYSSAWMPKILFKYSTLHVIQLNRQIHGQNSKFWRSSGLQWLLWNLARGWSASPAKFQTNRCNVSPLQGEKPIFANSWTCWWMSTKPMVRAVVQLVEYRTRNLEVAGSTHTRSTASNLEQVAHLLCAQANSASYPQRDGKWVVATATGWRPSVADWDDGVSASCTVGPIVRYRGQWMAT